MVLREVSTGLTVAWTGTIPSYAMSSSELLLNGQVSIWKNGVAPEG
jgi:hypothetical protein